MAPIGSSHGGEVKYFNNKLVSLLRGKAIVSIQDPIILGGHAEPQPDIALLRWRDDFYRTANPHAEDVLLVIEVSTARSATTATSKCRSTQPRHPGSLAARCSAKATRNLPTRGWPVQQRDCRQTGKIAPILCRMP